MSGRQTVKKDAVHYAGEDMVADVLRWIPQTGKAEGRSIWLCELIVTPDGDSQKKWFSCMSKADRVLYGVAKSGPVYVIAVCWLRASGPFGWSWSFFCRDATHAEVLNDGIQSLAGGVR